ncbi:hypothetical protein [Pinibacter soli]|uniref:Uncharacterized protein n=1 Tax=Pinibacter soli TaxID=3044211 RepID=A0ABT6RHD6_9BACT|nr:hypothetical protein [Pinibacter soli]MDI3321986.1 hypothetical protein [Pinibacter soli]
MQDPRKTRFVRIPQSYLDLVNQVFEIERKTQQLKEDHSIQRNINRLKSLIESELFASNEGVGLTYHDPLGEPYSQTRTDCEASIAGNVTEDLEIVEVIKPIIFCNELGNDFGIKKIIQKAVIVAASCNKK